MSRRDAEFAAFIVREALNEAELADCGYAAACALADGLEMAFSGCDAEEIARAVAPVLLRAVRPDFWEGDQQ